MKTSYVVHQRPAAPHQQHFGCLFFVATVMKEYPALLISKKKTESNVEGHDKPRFVYSSNGQRMQAKGLHGLKRTVPLITVL